MRLTPWACNATSPPSPEIDVRLFWHARLDADPAQRWLRDTIRDALS
jgi:DNA-binding transcriptional LysR family regulator